MCIITGIVLEEIDLAPPAVAALIRRRIAAVQPTFYQVTEAVKTLAQAYIASGILPERRETDARHVAVATVNGIDYLVSWNHRHMTRPTKRLEFDAVNRLNGLLHTPLICNPVEACDELRGG